MDKEDAIAIIGIACRFPGADDIDEFWEVLKNGEDHVKIVPKERWDTESINIPKLDNDWKPEAMWCGLIKDHDKFDNKFFGISDSEAGWMDPQQCLALEVTYTALENAGLTRQRIKGTNSGVYIGVMNRDVSIGMNDAAAEFNNFLVTGIASSIISNLISYHFDIRGPSMTIDTACSSALVSIHLGCQAIQSGDCEIAICGGVNSVLTPINYIALSKARMISKTGKSHTFSADADGYARGEGCGMVVLKSLKKARADGDKIWGIVMSGCNQDGKACTPITAPSGQQQKTLLQRIYSQHEISPSTIQYIEAHGTGTPIGDPTETNALAEFFGVKQEQNRKIPIGSVKTNIGHLESSAGTAGLIKVLLMMKYEKIVPSLHYTKEKGNKNIDFEKIPLEVATKLCDWKPHQDGTRISCVNSFGFGGTNSHAIVKQLVSIQKSSEIKTNNAKDFFITLSAPTVEALENTARHFQKKLSTEIYNIQDLSFTTVRKREHFRYRIGLVAKTMLELKTKLSDTVDNFKIALQKDTKESQIIFLFCGVGTLWLEMCKNLLETYGIFKKTVEEIDKEIRKHVRFSILEKIKNPPPDFLTDSFLGPITIFTCQIGLFKMWQSLGVSPHIIIGQSVGEVAAAYAAGCLTLSEAVKIIYMRSLLSSKAPSGRMVVVGKCNVNKLEEVCKSYGETLNIAVYSSKETCVVSGNEIAIKGLKDNLSNNPSFPSVLLTDLDVTCPYHSHYMKEASEKLEYELRDLKGTPPTVKIISTVSGKEITGAEMGTAEYWSNNLRKPVLLIDAVTSAVDIAMNNIFLEIGPKPVIRAHLKMITDAEAESIPSCNSPDDGNTFVKAVAALHVRNIKVNIEQIVPSNGNLTDIPRHKFYRSGTLLTSETVRATLKCVTLSRENHPFISAKPFGFQFSVMLSTETTPYIYEHVLDHTHIVPGALHAEIGLTVAKALSGLPLSETSISLFFLKPVFVGKKQTVELDVYVSKEVGSFEIKRQKDVVCKGKFFTARAECPVMVDIGRIKDICPFHVSQQLFYDTLRELGFEYGKILTVIQNSWTSDTEYIAELTVPSEIVDKLYTVNLHPCILDGVLQTLSVPLIAARTIRQGIPVDLSHPIPVKLGEVSVKRTPKRTMYVYGKTVLYTNDKAVFNLLLLSENGDVIAEINNYEVKNVSPGHAMLSFTDISYNTRWLAVEVDYDLRKTIGESEKMICVCLSEETYAKCQNYFTSATCSAYRLNLSFPGEFKPDTVVKRLLEDIQSQTLNLNELNGIIYFPGYDHSLEGIDTEEVYHCIKASCLCLLKLLQIFIKESINIPILVVTKNTQPTTDVKKQKYNITGSELWGMCRSIMRERTYSNLRLVDISDDNDLQNLFVIMENLQVNDFWKFTPEFKCSDNTIYINQIVRFYDDSIGCRMNHYNENQPLDMRSSSHENLEDLFFIPKLPLQGNPKYCSLKVEMALVNPALSPLTTTLAIDDPDPWKANRVDGHGLIATEVCGKIDGNHFELQEEKPLFCLKSRKVFPENNHNQVSYLSCFPCNVSNRVHVPVSCLMNKDEFAQYKPGIMHECIWYFGLLSELNPRQPLGIIYDKTLSFNLDLLHSILAFKSHKTVFAFSVDEFREYYNISGKFQLILLTKKISSMKDSLAKMTVIASKIITYSQLINKAEERILRQQLPSMEICIINNDDMLSEHQLSKLVKLLRTWLSKKAFIKFRTNTTDTKNESIISFKTGFRADKIMNCEDFPVKTDKRYLFSKSSGYMIIGGLTGLGWETVELIAQMGGGCVAILSRQQPSEERQKDINAISEKYGCKIVSLKADVSDINSVTNAFQLYQRECQSFQLRGIFHGAAVVDDAIIVYMTEEKFEKVLRPKVKGTLNLHLLTKDMNLDYFVLHSSITAAFGNAGQSNYGAGNAFMDTFAYFRRSLGLCGQTINWGALHLGLLTASENVEKHLNAQGYHSLKPADIMECLLHTLCSNFPQMIYGIFKWETIFRQSPDMIHLTSKLQPILKELNLLDIFTGKQGKKIIVDLEELHSMSMEKRQTKINEVLVSIAADIFAVDESLVKTSTKFSQLGIDSMKAMAFINTIYEHLSCKIPVMNVLDDDANIESMTTLIINQIFSSDITGMVPVDIMMKLKYDNNHIRVNLNEMERAVYFFEIDSGNFSFLQADVSIISSDIDERTVEIAFKNLCSLYPEIGSIYAEENGVPYRLLPRQLWMTDDVKFDQNFLKTLKYVPNEDVRVPTFRDSPVLDAFDTLPLSQIVIYDGRVVKVICLKHDNIFGVRLLCDRILFDHTSTTKLALDLISIIEGKSLPENTDNISSNTMNDELKEVITNGIENGKSFWSRHTSLTIRPVILTTNPSSSDAHDTIKIHRINLQTDLNNNLGRFLASNSLSCFEFFTTVFQMCLHLISRNEVVSVVSFVDLRQFLSTNSSYSSMENLIPYIAFFRDMKISVLEFLMENVSSMREAIKYSIIPFHDIEQMLKSAGENAFSYAIVINKDSAVAGSSGKTQNARLTSIKCFDSRFHIALHISEDIMFDQTALSLHFKTNIIDDSTAIRILQGLVRITDAILNNKRVTMGQIKENFDGTKVELIAQNANLNSEQNTELMKDKDGVVQKKETIIFKGSSLNETTHGQDHKGDLHFIETENKSQILQWNAGTTEKVFVP